MSPSVYVEQTKIGYRLIRKGEHFYMKGGAASSQYLEELMEWDLIKKDIFGNELAIKKMGTGAEIKNFLKLTILEAEP